MGKFNGFPKEFVVFLKELAENNNREWYNKHRDDYKTYCAEPSFLFIDALGAQLAKYVKNLAYEAKVDRSLFRIYKDTRFSRDKSPYKTHLGILFWLDFFPVKHENPGFYIQLERENIILATGSWFLIPPVLLEFRSSLLDKKAGAEFTKVLKKFEKDRVDIVGENPLKQPPAGFPKDHPLAEYAKYRGIYANYSEFGLADIVFSRDFIDYALTFFIKTIPLLNWLGALTQRAANKAK
ncbi:MAG: DUF2461 domain-containing protein [Deferribacteraceae bacterium]|jgi:uncharacterized protein (TIGR02453 family)|nr:DUF2461 domain-containing protein [Deferribacteraceae bacterium]